MFASIEEMNYRLRTKESFTWAYAQVLFIASYDMIVKAPQHHRSCALHTVYM